MTGALGPVSEDELQGYIDGQIDYERRVAVERYLDANPEVRERVLAYSAQRDVIRLALSDWSAPSRRSLDVAALVGRQMARRRRSSWRVAAAVGLIFAFGSVSGGVAGWLFASRPMTEIDALARDGAASYFVFTVDKRRPVELWDAERDDLTRWVSNRLNRPVSPPDLAGQGYRLLGGRLVPTARGPAAMFMYESGEGSRLVVLERAVAGQDSGGPEERSVADSVDGYAWVVAGVGYSMVAAEPKHRLRELSEGLYEQMQLSRR